MTDEQNEQLKQKVKEAITQSNTPFAKTLKYIDMSAVPKNEINAMVDRHIISPEFAKKAADKALVISEAIFSAVCVILFLRGGKK